MVQLGSQDAGPPLDGVNFVELLPRAVHTCRFADG